MEETSGAEGQRSVGELAKACGVTVRALHDYDEIGLLSPAGRTASGHRRYNGQDVRRLYRMLENHFTPQHRRELAARRAELGGERIEAAKLRWAGLVDEGLRYVVDGTPVSDPSVRAWARSWDDLGSLVHSGEQTKTAARALWQDNSEALSADLPWSADQLAGLVAYLHEARTLG